MQNSIGDADDVNRTGQEKPRAAWGGQMDVGEAQQSGGSATGPSEGPLEHLGHANRGQHLAGKVGQVVREDALARVDSCVGGEHDHCLVGVAQGHVGYGAIVFPGSHRREGAGNAHHRVGTHAASQQDDA